MSRADFHDLETIFAQLEAKDSGWEEIRSYLMDWRSSALRSCLTPESLGVESEVTLYCVKQSVSVYLLPHCDILEDSFLSSAFSESFPDLQF